MNRWTWLILGAACIVLSFLAVFNEVKSLGLGVNEARLAEHDSFLVRSYARDVAGLLEYLNVPRPSGVALITIRLLVNVFFYAMCARLWQRLGLTPIATLLGLMALTWSMTAANYGSPIDPALYLGAGVALLAADNYTRGGDRYVFLAVSLFASVSYLPFALLLPLARHLPAPPKRRVELVICLVIAAPSLLHLGYIQFVRIDFQLFANLSDPTIWPRAFAVVSILPLIALLRPSAIPKPVAQIALFFAVPWVLFHLFLWDCTQPRVWVPLVALVFVPAALSVLSAKTQTAAAPERA